VTEVEKQLPACNFAEHYGYINKSTPYPRQRGTLRVMPVVVLTVSLCLMSNNLSMFIWIFISATGQRYINKFSKHCFFSRIMRGMFIELTVSLRYTKALRSKIP
jgi:cell division protein FtsW (lipid II flippase)